MSVFELTEEAPERALVDTKPVLEKLGDLDLEPNSIAFSEDQKVHATNLMEEIVPGLASVASINFIWKKNELTADDFEKMTGHKKRLMGLYMTVLAKMKELQDHMLDIFKAIVKKNASMIKENLSTKGVASNNFQLKKKIYLVMLAFIGRTISSFIFSKNGKQDEKSNLTFISISDEGLRQAFNSAVGRGKNKGKGGSTRGFAKRYLKSALGTEFLEKFEKNVQSELDGHSAVLQNLRKYVVVYNNCTGLLSNIIGRTRNGKLKKGKVTDGMVSAVLKNAAQSINFKESSMELVLGSSSAIVEDNAKELVEDNAGEYDDEDMYDDDEDDEEAF